MCGNNQSRLYRFKEEIARTEYRIYRLACLMMSLIDRTRNFIVSKQSKNWEEIQVCLISSSLPFNFFDFLEEIYFAMSFIVLLQADLEDAEEVEEESSDEEDGDEDEIIQGIKVQSTAFWHH